MIDNPTLWGREDLRWHTANSGRQQWTGQTACARQAYGAGDAVGKPRCGRDDLGAGVGHGLWRRNRCASRPRYHITHQPDHQLGGQRRSLTGSCPGSASASSVPGQSTSTAAPSRSSSTGVWVPELLGGNVAAASTMFSSPGPALPHPDLIAVFDLTHSEEEPPGRRESAS